MKIKLREAVKHAAHLASLSKKVFPSKLSFAISCNTEMLQKEAERAEKERLKICERYAEKDENGKPIMLNNIVNGNKVQEYKINEEGRRALLEEYNDLLETEVEIEIRKVNASILEKCETADRYTIPSVADINAMAFMLEE